MRYAFSGLVKVTGFAGGFVFESRTDGMTAWSALNRKQTDDREQVDQKHHKDGGDGAYRKAGDGLFEVFVHSVEGGYDEIAQTAGHVARGHHRAGQQGDLK